VTFLTHKHGKTPFKIEIDLHRESPEDAKAEVKNRWGEFELVRENYTEFVYDTYDDYAGGIPFLINNYTPDAIVLAAAVSDYTVSNKVEGKMRTNAQMNIELEPCPKLISKIRNEWGYKGILVGFKLLVDSSREELIAAARESVIKNGCNFVVANDLRSLQEGDHRIILVTESSEEDISSLINASQIIKKIESLV